MTTTRRSFLQLLGGTAVATAVAPALTKASPDLAAVGPELVATAKSKGRVVLKWNSIEGAHHYLVQVKRGNEYLERARVKGDRFVFDNPLEKGRIHHVMVRAVTAEGNMSEGHSVTIEGQEYDPTDYDWPGDID